VRIAILGGTGSFGRALAARLAEAGEDEVVIGSRDPVRARTTAHELGRSRVQGMGNDEAVRGADLVVLAVNAEGALDTATTVADALGETPLLSVASVLRFSRDGVRPDRAARSLAERVQAAVRAPVAAGLHSIAAVNLSEARPDEDALVCGDHPRAKELALEVAAKVVAGRALDAGPLESARTLEGLTAVIVNLNRRYKAHAGIRVSGVPNP
jgi:8-hydroxy-5-deazaflavin:NADPH oxidoreductase